MCVPSRHADLDVSNLLRWIDVEPRLFSPFSALRLFFSASLTAGRALMVHSSRGCSANQRARQHPRLGPSPKCPGLQKHVGGAPELLSKALLYRKRNIFIHTLHRISSFHYKISLITIFLSIGRIIHFITFTSFDHVCTSPKLHP